jgi:hypothetical protein
MKNNIRIFTFSLAVIAAILAGCVGMDRGVSAPPAAARVSGVSLQPKGSCIEDWSEIHPKFDIGAYADTRGSNLRLSSTAGPDGGKALKLVSFVVQGGWCGIWRNIYVDLSGNTSLTFKVKSNAAGEIQIALTDGYDVQFTTRFVVSAKDWMEVTVPLSSFRKNPDYTAPDAELGHPMDLTTIKALGLAPRIAGYSIVEIGPIDAKGTSPFAAVQGSGTSSAAGIVRQVNPDFSQGKRGWDLWADWTGKAEFSAVDGRALVKIISPGTLISSLGLANFDVRVEKDRMYKVEFEANSDPPMRLKSLVMLNRAPHTEYSGFRYFNLTKNNKKYSYTFIMRHDTDPAARFAFEFGGQIKSTITLDNVTITDMGRAEKVPVISP